MSQVTKYGRLKPESLHQSLNLPSGYHIAVSVEGHVDRSALPADKHHFRLRLMRSTTAGQVPVYALSESWGPWRESTVEEFTSISKEILGIPSEA